jgi:hypothetical protein
VQRQQSNAVPRHDQVLDQLQAVDLVGDARAEAVERAKCAHGVLVGGVAGVDDPGTVGVRGDVDDAVGRIGANTKSPGRRPQREGLQDRSRAGGREVVVVGQRQVQVVVGEQREGLDGFVLADHDVDGGMGIGQLGEDRQQRHPDAGGETADPKGAHRFGVGVEIQSRGVDGGQDRHGVIGQPAAGGSEADTPALRLDQRHPGLLGERGDLLRHRRGGQVMCLGDRPHRAEA